MPNRKVWDNSDPQISDDLFEEENLIEEDEDAEWQRDIATKALYDTAHTDGHTWNPDTAWEQGLTYTPPEDPPVIPSDDLEGVEMAAGFAPSAEQAGADQEDYEDGVPYTDDDLEDDLRWQLRHNSETMDLTNITVRVEDGVVTLLGTVPNDSDIAIVDDLINDVADMVDVDNRLDTEY